MQKQSFQVQESTVQFFYEVDQYWKDHGKEKTKLSKKLKPLYKGICGYFLSPSREAFLYRNPSRLISYKIVQAVMSRSEYMENILGKAGFFKEYYNAFCGYYFKCLNSEDIKTIHEMYKDYNFPLVKDTYSRCL